ncbi:anthranilate synthase component I [Desertibacillus haloalkaliphilus]|nr:anthranilate synthase component I [Desertibacillus haloalkaliphilus]
MEQQNRCVIAKNIPFTTEKWYQSYKQLTASESHHILLESGRGGKYSMVGLRPFAVLKGKDSTFSVTTQDGTKEQTGNPLELMKQWMKSYKTEKVPEYPDFQGGAIGYVSYDLVRKIEDIGISAEDDLRTYDLYFLVFDDVFVFDHVNDTLWLMTHYLEGEKAEALDRLERYEQQWCVDAAPVQWQQCSRSDASELETSFTETQFAEAVKRVKAYIASGDVFQVNLSVRQARPLQTEPLHIYEKLREINPSPYMGYFHTPDFQLVSGSPELLVKKDGNEVSTRPIAGTRSRGKDADEDERLAKTLIENEKERAEHVMLVDLERNDLGRVCKYGSVEVNELMVIEKYSHVMHIVSNVRGELAPENDAYDIIAATFPGGTITGAPKVRTMEIIEELEPVRRGVYTGSIGWIGFNGDMELNIAIRTMVAKDGKAYVQAGAGIVIDSDPEAEYKESLKKAKALWRAKELSEEEMMN